MNTTQRILPYVRQYVIVAIYEVLEQDRIRYEKTDSSTIVSEISVYGNKSVFSIYLENETVLANASLRRSKLQESVCKA